MSRYVMKVFAACMYAICACFGAQAAGNRFVADKLDQPVLHGEILTGQAEVAGSRYLFDGWLQGDVQLQHGAWVRDVPVRYDGYADVLQWNNEETSKIVAIEKQAVRAFVLPGGAGGDSLRFVRMPLSIPSVSGLTETYVQVLYENKYVLYQFHRVLQTGVQRAVRNNISVELPLIQYRPVYYLSMPDGSMRQFQRISRSSVLGLHILPRAEMRRIISEHRLPLRYEADLLELLRLLE